MSPHGRFHYHNMTIGPMIVYGNFLQILHYHEEPNWHLLFLHTFPYESIDHHTFLRFSLLHITRPLHSETCLFSFSVQFSWSKQMTQFFLLKKKIENVNNLLNFWWTPPCVSTITFTSISLDSRSFCELLLQFWNICKTIFTSFSL